MKNKIIIIIEFKRTSNIDTYKQIVNQKSLDISQNLEITIKITKKHLILKKIFY